MKIWTSIFAFAMGAVVMAQTSTVLYAPVRLIKDQNISLRSWGSGTISETDEAAYEGTNSIRISSRNFFQGGSIVFGSGTDLNAAYADKNNLLRLIYRPIDSNTTFGGTGGGAPGLGGRGGGDAEGAPGGRGGPGAAPGGRGGGGIPGGVPGGRGGGAPGGIPGGVPGGRGGAAGGQGLPPGGLNGIGGIPSGLRGGQGFPGGGLPGGLGRGAGMAGNAQPTGLKTLRFIITTTDNKKSEAYVPVTTSSAGDKGWKSVAVPLQAISGFDRTNRVIKEIALAGDTTTSFFVGDIRVINDTTPIRGEANYKDINLALGQEVTFTASGTGGSSVLKYTWDFDSADGIQVDAEGQLIKRKFRKAGSYVITLTVQDEHGLKAPYSTTIKVKVNP
ncbi:MAG: PKD domain-containing protein [Fimbriimonas sp.]